MTTKILIVKPSSEIPPIGTDEFSLRQNISSFYFAKCETIGRDITLSVVCYDFKSNKWLFKSAGCINVIEYYLLDERFDKWVHTQNRIDLDTLSDIWMAFDEQDK